MGYDLHSYLHSATSLLYATALGATAVASGSGCATAAPTSEAAPSEAAADSTKAATPNTGHSAGHHGSEHGSEHGSDHAAHHGGDDTGFVHHGPVHHRFDDAEKWAATFEAPERTAWQQPDVVVHWVLEQHKGPVAVLADLGAGTGYFAARFAAALPEATVLGLDIEPAMVDWMKQRATRDGLANLKPALVAGDDPKLGAQGSPPVDVLFICNTWHHIPARPDYLKRHVIPQLAEGGQIAIVDFLVSSPKGPPAKHKLDAQQIIDEMSQVGMSLSARNDSLSDQYILVFEKAASPHGV